ncbi:MAG: LPS assembly protein LptD [Candidatus Solibacter sp.]
MNPGEEIERPPAVPPKSLAAGDWNLRYRTQDIAGHVYKLRGSPGLPAEIENSEMLFRADEIDFDQDTGEVRATGHVFFHDFGRNMKMWAGHLTYNTDEKTGRFYDVIGETKPHIVAKPGVLTTDNPFHFEGEWAERLGTKYVLHEGFITNCKLPTPWWRLRGKSFDIIPGKRVIAHNSTFILRRMPLFFTPFFYHSLEKEPRKSGFLLPLIGHSSRRGWMVHGGYFWAINRSNDVTYRAQYYTSRGLVHHVDYRGKPRAGTDYDVILYGVQDRGAPDSGTPRQKFSGISLLAVGQSDLGKGWTARANINYISSFRFRQEWSESYSDIIGSEIHSVAYANKNWSSFTVNAIFARLQNFQSTEIAIRDTPDAEPHYVANAVNVRKLPEVEFSSRNRRIWDRLPFYFSFDSSTGLLYRYEPVFNKDNTALVDTFQTGNYMNRSSIAPHVTTAFHWAGIHIVPSFGIQEIYYGEAQAPYQDRYRVVGTNIVRSARDFSVDIMLPTLARVFNKKTIFGDKLKHTIEPRATYRYVTGIGDNYTRFIRFDERDLWADTNELMLSVANRIYARRNNTVEEIFSWEVFQKRYFNPTFGGALVEGQRNVIGPSADLTAYAFLAGPRTTSPVVSVMRMTPVTGLGIRWQTDYDPRNSGIVDSSFSMDYRFRSKYFFSGGHDMVHTDPAVTTAANQFRIRGGFGDPNHRGWNAASEAIYDFKQGVIQYTTSQVTYNTNCCGLSVQFHRYNIGSNLGARNDFRVAFAVANISTPLGNLKKQDRMF